MNNKGLNTKQVGALFGVDESTVRRWALSDKIECSLSAGGHRKFSYKNIIDFSNKKRTSLNLKSKNIILNSNKIIKQILNYSLKNNISEIELILIKLYLNGMQLTELMDDILENVLVSLQSQLDNNKISVAEEHIARKIISKSLSSFKYSINNKSNKSNKNILCLNLENDIPDLPIDMIEILLEDINYNVHNCGSHTSIDDVKNLLDKQKYEAICIYLCDRQCCTSTIKHNIIKTNNDLKSISILAEKYNIKLFLGGPSFKNIDKNILLRFNQFIKYSELLPLI